MKRPRHAPWERLCTLSLPALLLALWLTGAAAAPAAEVHPALRDPYQATRSVWVVLRDKGQPASPQLSRARAEAEKWVAPPARSRRAMRGSLGADITHEDLPLTAEYLDQILATGVRRRALSRWFNAVSVEATWHQLAALERLACVARLDPVWKAPRDYPKPASPSDARERAPRPDQPDQADDPIVYGNSQSQLEQINVLAAHAGGWKGTGVRVGILDTGFYKGHEALVTRDLLMERDFVFDDDDVQRDPSNPDDYSDAHGTAIWSQLGGFRNGSLVGVAFKATFLLAKTEDIRSETPVEEDYWIAAIEWMEANGVDVVNSSLSYPSFYTYPQLDGNTARITLAANRAAALGVVVCNSAGNSGPTYGSIGPPADAHVILSAGAVTATGALSFFRSRGPTADGRIKPEVCARGSSNWIALETRPGTSYGTGSGTSYSSPLIAGAAALVVQAHPDWRPARVREALLMTADRHAAPGNEYGWGIINVLAAIKYNRADVHNWDLYE